MRAAHQRAHEDFVGRWLLGLETGTRGKTNISAHIVRWLKRTRGEKCESCGWCDRHPITGRIPVEVHHLDGVWNHNQPENLQLLCPNCHSLTGTFRNIARLAQAEERPPCKRQRGFSTNPSGSTLFGIQ